ncbi:hypothetical protein CYR40_22720, partial [Chimaeribacter arupi]
SKTAAEVTELQKALNLTEVPFIAENGAVIALPESWGDHLAYPRKVFGAEYGEIRKIIDALRLRYDFECRGFGDGHKIKKSHALLLVMTKSSKRSKDLAFQPVGAANPRRFRTILTAALPSPL